MTRETNWRWIGDREGIHWPDLDEDISVENLLRGCASGESQDSFRRWLEMRQSHNEYIMGPQSDLVWRTKHWQVLEASEKALDLLLSKRLLGDFVLVPLNYIAEEMVAIYGYRRSLLCNWLLGAQRS